MAQFFRLVGSEADVKELEYISALHQTCTPSLRRDGSIQGEDIKAYLQSRFGIDVTLEEVQRKIMQGLGGSDDVNEVIDLMELTAILLIPLLLKAGAVEQHKQEQTGGEKAEDLPSNILFPPRQLLETALRIILHDVAGEKQQQQHKDYDSSSSPTFHQQLLDADFIKQMLSNYGETNMAEDENLIKEMIQQATANGEEDSDRLFLDVETFAEALTKDIKLYNIANEANVSTLMQDVFQEEINNRNHDELKQINTAPEIDIQAGTYRSKALAVSLWGCVLFGLFTSAIELAQSTSSSCEEIGRGQEWMGNLEAFRCRLNKSVTGWLFTFLYFSAVGIISIGFGSMGNYFGHSKTRLPIIASVCVLMFGFLSTHDYQEMVNSRSYLKYMAHMSQALACLTVYFHACNYVAIAYPHCEFLKSTWARRLGCTPLTRERHVKAAGAHKANQMVNNAMALMMNTEGTSVVFDTYFSHGLSAFALNGRAESKEGGVFWLWRRIRDQSIFDKEGIWYSTRLVASNFTQFAICFFILLLGTDIVLRVQTNFGPENFVLQANWLLGDIIDFGLNLTETSSATNNLTNVLGASYATMLGQSSAMTHQCQDLVTSSGSPTLIDSLCHKDSSGTYECSGSVNPDEAICILKENPNLADLHPDAASQLLETTGFSSMDLHFVIQSQLELFLNQTVQSMYPQEMYMVTLPLIIGMIVAVLAALRQAVFYLPGVTTTILELRSGAIPSLKSPTFQKYREAPDTVSMLTGSLFWGCLMSSIFFGSVVGFLVFLCVWQGSLFFMLRMSTVLIGIICIIGIKFVVFHFFFRRRYYKGLYRTNPAESNVALLALEWANFVFTSAFILVRMIKIVFISIASIGQIDRRLLAEGVGQLGSLEFDPYPTIHIRDLVAHEAHRHPYIEILGTVYLMKLRYSTDFGSRAGSAWRLIFIYALMPWMHQYRIKENRTRAVEVEVEADGDEEVPPANLGGCSPADRGWRLIKSLMPWMDHNRMQITTAKPVDAKGDIEAPSANRRLSAFPEELLPLKTSPRTGMGLVQRKNELAPSMPPSLSSDTSTSVDVDAYDGVEAPEADPDKESSVTTLPQEQQQPMLGNSSGTRAEPQEVGNQLTLWMPQSCTSVTTTFDEDDANVDEESPAANHVEDDMLTTLSERPPSLRNSSQTSNGPAKAENRWVLWIRESRRSVSTNFFDAHGGEEAPAAELDVDHSVSILPDRLPPLKNSNRIIVRSLEEENRRLEEENKRMKEKLSSLGIDLQNL